MKAKLIILIMLIVAVVYLAPDLVGRTMKGIGQQNVLQVVTSHISLEQLTSRIPIVSQQDNSVEHRGTIHVENGRVTMNETGPTTSTQDIFALAFIGGLVLLVLAGKKGE